MDGKYLDERQIRGSMRDKVSFWKTVTSGMPQGSVLAPFMILIYVKDMLEGLNNYINFLADDAKILKRTVNNDKCMELREDLLNNRNGTKPEELSLMPKMSCSEDGKEKRKTKTEIWDGEQENL